MDLDEEEELAIVAAVQSASVAVSQFNQAVAAVACAASQAAAEEFMSKTSNNKQQLRYLSGGVMASQKESFWDSVLEVGDDLEFQNFLLFSRPCFLELLALTEPIINSMPIQQGKGKPRECDLKRRKVDAGTILALTLKYLTSSGEAKDIGVHFGVLGPSFSRYVLVGMSAIITALMFHEKSRVYWDRSEQNLRYMAHRTRHFLLIPGVIAMLDGKKLVSHRDEDNAVQNRDYNGWTADHNRNMVLLWDANGKIVDCGLNLPGSFHDSKMALWCNIYDHIAALPEGYKVACDSAFYTKGRLKGKLVKLKDQEGNIFEDVVREPTEYGNSLTHLRQVSEWGNNSLVKVFKRLDRLLPTDNEHRLNLQWACVLLFNFRVEVMGINQTYTYFNNLEDEYGSSDEELNE